MVVNRSIRWTAAAAAVLTVAWSPIDNPRANAAPNPTPPDGFALELVLGGHGELSNPIAAEFAPDGTVFVAQKNGIIKRFDGLGDPTAQTFADLRTEVFNYADKGMLGLEVDPAFTTGRPYVYAAYAYDAPPGEAAPFWGDTCPDPPGATTSGCTTTAKVVRFTVTGNDPAGTPLVLVDGTDGSWCHQFPSHTIGHLAIGPDGQLYVSAGEGANFNTPDYGQLGVAPLNPCGDPGGSNPTAPTAEGGALRAQDARTAGDPQSLDGALIRVNPDALNPAPSIVAYGLRNPFRFTFRPGGDEIYVADVGWTLWEEINRVGDANDATIENFGWPCYEGASPENSYNALALDICEDLYTDIGNPPTAPTFTYSHNGDVVSGETCDRTDGSAATGVAFYEGGGYPTEYNGALFFADFTRQCVWSVPADANGDPIWNDRRVFMDHGRYFTDLEVGPGGDLYVVDSGAGRISRIHYYVGNRPPVAQIGANTTSGPIPLTVNFDANGSTDPDIGDGIASVEWDLDGDGAYDDSTSFTPSVQFTEAGRVIVGLRVTDGSGATDTDSIAINPAETPPVPLVLTPAATSVSGVLIADDLFTVGDTISFSGVALDSQDGIVPEANYSWELRQQHCVAQGGCHAHLLQTFDGVAAGSFDAPDHAHPSYLELEFFATDSAAQTTSQVLRLDPLTATLSITTTPTGLRVSVDSATSTAPFQRTVLAGSQHTIAPIEPQESNGMMYEWGNWSDSGTKSHTVTVPGGGSAVNGTYVATGPAPSSFDYRIASVDGRTERFRKNDHRTEAGSLQTPPLAGAASTPTRAGFWRVSAIGKVAAVGDARRHGDLRAAQRTAAVVDIEGTATGRGYWILLADGNVHAFGDARDWGQPTRRAVGGAAVAIARTPTGRGYWITDATGHVYDYGDARWRGSLANSIHAPVVDLNPMPDGRGYWLLTEQGVVAAYGSATNHGSHIGSTEAVAILPTPTGDGYWLLGANGMIWDYGDAPRYGRWTRGSRPIALF